VALMQLGCRSGAAAVPHPADARLADGALGAAGGLLSRLPCQEYHVGTCCHSVMQPSDVEGKPAAPRLQLRPACQCLPHRLRRAAEAQQHPHSQSSHLVPLTERSKHAQEETLWQPYHPVPGTSRTRERQSTCGMHLEGWLLTYRALHRRNPSPSPFSTAASHLPPLATCYL